MKPDMTNPNAHGVGIVELIFLGPVVAFSYRGLPVRPIYADGL